LSFQIAFHAASSAAKFLSRPIIVLVTSFVLLLSYSAQPAAAYEIDDRVTIFGVLQSWVTIHEQMEDAKGLFQYPPDKDEAVDSASGFSIHRVRLGGDYWLIPKRLQLNGQIKFEKPVGLLDINLRLRIADWLNLRIGQFKTPGSYEAMQSAYGLDFVLRTTLATLMSDYSLSRTVHASSHFAGTRAYFRDAGIGLFGDIDIVIGSVRYFGMIGNGLGNNLFIGGETKREFIITNGWQFLYAGRLELADLFDIVTIGGHASYNKHDNMVLNSGRKVLDLDRTSWSADARIHIPFAFLDLAGVYGAGEIHEDYDRDKRGDLDYSGWEVRALWDLSAFLGQFVPGSFLAANRFGIGCRFDRFDRAVNHANEHTIQDNWTAGINYGYKDVARFQLNYIWRKTRHPVDPDLADNVLLLNIQGKF
jgi:hypothetical protein